MTPRFLVRGRLRMILQTEAAECGLACLAMVAGFHGFHTDLSSLRSRHAVSLKGATLAQLMKIADAMDLQSRPVRLHLKDLGHLRMPCILHWDLKHFVVLRRVTPKCVEVFDPARGVRKLTHEEASRSFTGVALELLPAAGFQARRERQQLDVVSMLRQVDGLRGPLVQLLVLAAAMEVFGLSLPFFSQWVIDDVLVSGDADLLVVLAAGLALVGLLHAASGWMRGAVLLHLTAVVNLQWTASAFTHLLRLPMTWYEKRHLGDIVSKFGSISALQHAMTGGAVGVAIDGIMTIVTLGVMLIYSIQLSMVALSAVGIYAALRGLRAGLLRTLSNEQIVHAARQQSFFMESVRGIQPLKLFNREGDRVRRFMNLAVDSTNASIAVQRQALIFNAFNGALVAAENALVLFLGARLVLETQLSVGMLVAFLGYKAQFVGRASSLIDQALMFRMLGLQTERLADIVLAKPEPRDPHHDSSDSHTNLPATIELRNVRFRYAAGEPWVLDGVSFTVAAGESVAITGASGCGKTTLLKIMLGQLEPQEGEVLAAGVPLRQLGLQRHRDRIGVVMQDDRLFAGSLAENIALFESRIDHERVEAAARCAAIHDEIARMPMGYHSLVGDMGSALSGGQRQRVLLARALYRNPAMLLLDEATSHLDTATEWAVNRAVLALDITRIVIAHRPQTIEAMGRVIVLGASGSVQAALPRPTQVP